MGNSKITQSTFLYFAYGSNLLKERLQLKKPLGHGALRRQTQGTAPSSRRVQVSVTKPESN
uniref:Gamma-glutamylcyclotransferase n=1 Tax=Neogobius melanostomus TaxID=47308 RepID=A0A8C6WVU7_9GOBI